jgi:hypothetical protein
MCISNIPDEVTELLHVIDKLLDGSISVTELGENNAVKTLKNEYRLLKTHLAKIALQNFGLNSYLVWDIDSMF